MDDMAASSKEHFAIFQQAQHLRGSILVMTWGLLLATRDDSKFDYTSIAGDSLKRLKRIHSNAVIPRLATFARILITSWLNLQHEKGGLEISFKLLRSLKLNAFKTTIFKVHVSLQKFQKGKCALHPGPDVNHKWISDQARRFLSSHAV